MPDPRLNCAAEICCGGGGGGPAQAARVSILRDMGVPSEYAEKCATKMVEMGIAFTSVELTKAIAEIANHPGRREPSS